MTELPIQPNQPEESEGGLASYYGWQVMTLMLAYDLAEPIPPGQEDRVEQRRREVAREIGEIVMDLLPQEYQDNPEKDFSPEIMMQITRSTLERAAKIAGISRG
ncbi:MAG: hypothetical protein ACOCTI_04935 [Phycisphaeraceae bacterium]